MPENARKPHKTGSFRGYYPREFYGMKVSVMNNVLSATFSMGR